jgi:hypothetical protein
MPMVQHGLVDQAKIKAAVQRAQRALKPDVVRIMYSFTVDWTGEQSLFFRVLLSDKASAPHRLRETTQRIIARIQDETKAEELGLQTYFNFRSKSEQEKLREPFWEEP